MPVAIGKPKEIINTITTRELIVTGGSEPYAEDDANTFNIETIKNAMAVRNEFLEELKNKKDTLEEVKYLLSPTVVKTSILKY